MATAKDRIKRNDPCLALLGELGMSISNRSDTGGEVIKGSGVPMVPGYGPVYRKADQPQEQSAKTQELQSFMRTPRHAILARSI